MVVSNTLPVHKRIAATLGKIRNACKDVSESKESVGLTYTLEDGFVLITSPEEADGRVVTRVHNVSKLVDPSGVLDETHVALEIDALIEIVRATVFPDSWREVGASGSLLGMGRHGVIICSNTLTGQQHVENVLSALHVARKSPNAAPPENSDTPFSREPEVRFYDLTKNVTPIDHEQLVELIRGMIAPDSWETSEPFSRRGLSIRAISGRLIVRHTAAAHAEIANLLDKMGVMHSSTPANMSGGMF